MKGGLIKMKSKKGVSEIVSTVLIVMISIAAVGIIAAVVVPMVRESLTGGQACLKALQDVSLDPENTCINKTGNKVYFGVKKGSDASISLVKVQVLLYKADGSRVVNETSVNLSLNELKIYNIGTGGTNYTAINIVPILKIGNKDKICDAPEGRIPLVECKN